MAFPPAFLDILRERLTLSEIIGRRIRVIRAGREFKACCPFHHEKTPSFTINDQKGFFHCFGCGAHGDVVGFVMRHDNLSFPEAVEHLAGQAGLEVPQSTPEERQREEKKKSLHDLVERVCKWYEQQLYEPVGRAARDYLARRGLTPEDIARFRLGFAPADRQTLIRRLAADGFTEDDMVTAGVARRPEEGGAPFAFFRNRVMFPVSDRRGRVVAFGGRIMDGDGPKYINTSETPLFHKGALLYGLSRARQAASDGQPVVVAEGYMDVIGLALAGFGGAVAPLGTALTEMQIQELWKLIPGDVKEPYLCFDGDSAGQRAAWRAVERILPHLGPGKSARVVFLPQGEDPDSLIRNQGPRAMEEALERAIPLSEALWRMESEGRRTDTPETKAALRAALEERAKSIADPTVQAFYRQDIRRRLDEAFAPASRDSTSNYAGFSTRNRPWVPGQRGGGWPGQAPRRHVAGVPGIRTAPPPGQRPKNPRRLVEGQIAERLLLAGLINHPSLFDEAGERLGMVNFPPGDLEALRIAVLDALSRDSGLDAAALCLHLASHGFDRTLPTLLAESTYVHGAFARPDASEDDARHGWTVTWNRLREPLARRDLLAAEAALARYASEANFARVQALTAELRRMTSGQVEMGVGEDDTPD